MIIPQAYPLYALPTAFKADGQLQWVRPPALVVAWRPSAHDPDMMAPCLVEAEGWDIIPRFYDGTKVTFSFHLNLIEAQAAHATCVIDLRNQREADVPA
jgi:hypothetical protein